MECVDLSDLEEGEILEYEPISPRDLNCNDNGIKGSSFQSFEKEFKSCDFHLRGSHEKDVNVCELKRDGFINKGLRSKWKNNGELEGIKPNISLIDLESISSDDNQKSDEENKYAGEIKKYASYGENRNERRKTTQFYGTVEEIMSEIGETICRKSRNYKKRKSKESPYTLNKYSDKCYDLWSHKVFSSHLRNRKHKRNVSFSDSDSGTSKEKAEKRKKKKKRKDMSYEEDKIVKKNSQVRDFDEMRRTLLEKLKKQKAEEESKRLTECAPIVENSEIQEVDMLVDCTNYVDNPRNVVPEHSTGEDKIEEKEGEDELDLIKLRLIALASNKRQKCEKELKVEEVSEKKKSDNSSEEVDLDRNELLLRAEALKTALLKKHQKRLNKLKVKKPESDSSMEKSLSCVHFEDVSVNGDAGACKENLVEESGSKGNENFKPEAMSNEVEEPSADSSFNLSKALPKPRTKRKKRKSVSANLKENNETIEEDDRTLRSQLLNDLMKKKSLKGVEEKSVLLETVQTSANKPPPFVINQPPKENEKPLPMVRKTLLKKVNPPKMGPKVPKAEIQRIIVHLGSEDSSDEDDEAAATKKQEKKKNVNDDSPNLNKAIHPDYVRSVELLLSQARKKIEGEKRNAEATSLATPEAVYKHLPPSQRLEYIRLKQKIAERERLRKEKADSADSKPINTAKENLEGIPEPENVKSTTKQPTSNVSKPLTFKVGGSTNLNGLKNTHRKVLNKTKNNLETGKEIPIGKPVVSIQRSKLLLPSSQALITKLKLLLKKIKIEKIIEENYQKEIVKLKNQLGLLEKKKIEQRFKIKKLGEESMKTYKAIQGITANGKTKDAVEKKKEVETETEKPEEGKKVSNEPEMEIISKAQSEPEKRLTVEKTSETSETRLFDYQSPLEMFNKESSCSERVDPNVMICQFDLTGVCKDEECPYQHLRAS